MLNIKPISNLRNYSDVLRGVTVAHLYFSRRTNAVAMPYLIYKTIKNQSNPYADEQISKGQKIGRGKRMAFI